MVQLSRVYGAIHEGIFICSQKGGYPPGITVTWGGEVSDDFHFFILTSKFVDPRLYFLRGPGFGTNNRIPAHRRIFRRRTMWFLWGFHNLDRVDSTNDGFGNNSFYLFFQFLQQPLRNVWDSSQGRAALATGMLWNMLHVHVHDGRVLRFVYCFPVEVLLKYLKQ